MAVPSNVPTVGQFSFTLKQGSDLAISMTWLDDTGAPINLTGYSMKMQIRAFFGSSVALLTLSSSASTGSYIALGGTAGTITLNFAHVDTATLQGNGQPSTTPGARVLPVGVYDLQFTDSAGNVGYLIEGAVSIDRQVTV
ncbi:hypothetical protein [Paraburkholderia tropica]|uniref:hypothetical protein n=1 Tax=Paraburkholderia tropica TaxID=92647 RepID=UPI000A600F66|nr:hypothetical protein [Paraburkholderia tropica]